MRKGLKSRQLPVWCERLLKMGLLSCVMAIRRRRLALLIAIHSAIISLPMSATMAASTLARLESWRFNPQTQQLEIAVSSQITPNYFYLPQPPRVVLDLPNTQLGYVSTRQDFSGAIQSIRVSQLKSGVTRIVMDLAPGTVLDQRSIQLQSIPGQNQTRWVLSPSSNYAGYQQGNINAPLRDDSPEVRANSSNYNNAPLPLFNGVNSTSDAPVNTYNNGYNNNDYNNNDYNNGYSDRPSTVITVPGVNTPALPPAVNNGLPAFTNLPPIGPNINNNSQKPFITVPTGELPALPPSVNYNPDLPITVNAPSLNSNNPNSGQLLPGILPPPLVNQQPVSIPGGLYPLPNTRKTNFPIPNINTINNNLGNQINPQVIEYGRPFPNK